MRSKRLIQLLITVIVVFGLAGLVDWGQRRGSQVSGAQTGDPLLPDFPLNQIESVDISSATGSTSLARDKGRWLVVDRYGYPADFNKLRRFMVGLSNLNIVRSMVATPNQYQRLGLATPDQDTATGTGTKIIFYDDRQQPVGTVILGNLHQAGNGQDGGWPLGRYVRIKRSSQDDLIALVAETFRDLVADPRLWLDQEFVKIRDVVEMSLTEDESLQWRIVRETADDAFSLVDFSPSETRKPDLSAMRQAANAFGFARFQDIIDPQTPTAETGLGRKARVITAKTAEGLVYTLVVGDKNEDDNYFFRIDHISITNEARIIDETDLEKAETRSAGDDNRDPEQSALEYEAARLAERFTPWIYLVRGSDLDRVLKEHSDLIKDTGME